MKFQFMFNKVIIIFLKDNIMSKSQHIFMGDGLANMNIMILPYTFENTKNITKHKYYY